MGLDGVELVLRTEETFGISLSDEEVSLVQTPRQLTDLVMKHLAAEPSGVCASQVAFHRLRRTLVADFATPRQSVTPESRWDQFFPVASRRKNWGRLSKALRLRLPPLERPLWLIALICVLTVACGAAVLQPFGSAIAVDSAAIVGVGLLALTSPARLLPPTQCRTVGATARYLAAIAPAELIAPTRPWSRAQVRDAVDNIIREVLRVSEVPEDARFVEDLGLS